MGEIDVSVILPFRDAADTLDDQLAALARTTTARAWELVMVDNGSTDRSADVASAWVDRFERAKLVAAHDRPGAGYARNVGVADARGSALLFCDADDAVTPDWLDAITDALELAPIVGGRCRFDRINPSWALEMRDLPQTDGLMAWEDPPHFPHVAACNMAMTRDVFERLGGFDVELTELADTELCARAALSGIGLAFVPDAVVDVRLRPTIAAAFRQSRRWGAASVALLSRLDDHGARPAERWRALAGWARLPVRVVLARSRGDLAQVAFLTGWKVGRVVGSIQHGVFAP